MYEEELEDLDWSNSKYAFRGMKGLFHITVSEADDDGLIFTLGDFEHGLCAHVWSTGYARLLGEFIADNCPPGFAGTVIETDVFVDDYFDLDPDEIGMLVADIAVGYTDDDISAFVDYLDDNYFSRF